MMKLRAAFLYATCFSLVTLAWSASATAQKPLPPAANTAATSNPTRASDLPVELIEDPRITRLEIAAPEGQARWRIQVARPDCAAPADGYPVLYLLDGDAVFPVAWRALSRLQQPCLALVAVGYPGPMRVNVPRRYLDFTPPTAEEYLGERGAGMATGGREDFLEFLTGPLRTEVARLLPIDNTKQALFGHSLGGLFALYALTSRPEQFQAYIIADPSLWWNGQSAIREMEAFFGGISAAGGGLDQPIQLHMLTSGSQPPRTGERTTRSRQRMPEPATRQLVDRFAQVRGLKVQDQHFPHETHGSLLPLSATEAVRFANGAFAQSP